jgi:DNA (cytosine-5)-methyltransferase 1
MSGKRDPNDPRARLFEDYLEIVKRLQPSVAVIENVHAIVSAKNPDGGLVIDEITSGFRHLGYEVKFQILNAADYGVPQKRKRAVIVATRVGISIPFPEPTHSKDPSSSNHRLPWVTVKDAIGDLEDVPEDKGAQHIFVKSHPKFIERIRATPIGESVAMGYRESFYRNPPDQPAITVKANNGGVLVHYSQHRLMSPRELARLQGFPDSFRFLGSKSAVLIMIGNAVPVGLAKAVATSVRGMLDEAKASLAVVEEAAVSETSINRNQEQFLAPSQSHLSLAARVDFTELRMLDLCSGIGAFRYAANSLGIRTVYSSEIDWDCKASSLANFGDLPAGDITRIDVKAIPAFDISTSGFPCQPWSANGKHGGFNDPRGRIIFDVIRILDHHRPACLLLENVPNLLNHDGGRSFKVITDALDAIGYTLYWKVLNPGDFGIPVARERLFIVGFQKDACHGGFSFPEPNHKTADISGMLLPDEETVRFLIEGRSDVVLFPNADNPPHEIRGRQAIKVGHIRGGRHTGDTIYSPYGHAGTFIAAGGKTGLYLVNGKVRRLHPRECARVLGFPDSFRFMGCDSTALHQVGNSAVVPLLRLIMVQMMKALGISDLAAKEAA